MDTHIEDLSSAEVGPNAANSHDVPHMQQDSAQHLAAALTLWDEAQAARATQQKSLELDILTRIAQNPFIQANSHLARVSTWFESQAEPRRRQLEIEAAHNRGQIQATTSHL